MLRGRWEWYLTMTEERDPTWVDIELDPTVQRMRGIATHGMVPFDVPYISHVIGNMYQGGCSTGLILPKHIKHVVSLYKWERYTSEHLLSSFNEYTMYDSEEGIPEPKQLSEIIDVAHACVEDGPTLIHCQAGLNRSSLVAALVLIRMGLSGRKAVDLLREKRSPAVLCNKAFERYVLAHDG